MSMTEPSIRDQAYKFFQQEALDLLQSLEDGLLNLRTQYDIPHIHELMRAAHSIKGGASSVQLPGIARIAHKLEDVFRALVGLDAARGFPAIEHRKAHVHQDQRG